MSLGGILFVFLLLFYGKVNSSKALMSSWIDFMFVDWYGWEDRCEDSLNMIIDYNQKCKNFHIVTHTSYRIVPNRSAVPTGNFRNSAHPSEHPMGAY